MSTPIKTRYDFLLIFDTQDGNPNGDPDAGNMPRIDAETGCGLVTDVCLKRKVRNFVQITQADKPTFDIFVKEKAVLNRAIEGAYADLGVDLTKPPADAKDGKKRNKDGQGQGSEIDKARNQMCNKYFDIRTFGAVLSVGANAGQVRGPVQLGFARSVDPIMPQEVTITRVAITTEADAEKKGTEMGRKYIVPYGLYRVEGYVSANLARKSTGFSEDDLNLLWQAILNMFELDRSAARGKMAVRDLIVFRHDSELGNAPAYKLFDLVKAEKNPDVAAPRAYSDYQISVDDANLPAGVTCMHMG